MNPWKIDDVARRSQAPLPDLPDRFAGSVLSEVRRRRSRATASRAGVGGWGMPGWRLAPAVAVATLAVAAVIGLEAPRWWPAADLDLSRQALELDILTGRGSDVPSVLLGHFP